MPSTAASAIFQFHPFRSPLPRALIRRTIPSHQRRLFHPVMFIRKNTDTSSIQLQSPCHPYLQTQPSGTRSPQHMAVRHTEDVAPLLAPVLLVHLLPHFANQLVNPLTHVRGCLAAYMLIPITFWSATTQASTLKAPCPKVSQTRQRSAKKTKAPTKSLPTHPVVHVPNPLPAPSLSYISPVFNPSYSP